MSERSDELTRTACDNLRGLLDASHRAQAEDNEEWEEYRENIRLAMRALGCHRISEPNPPNDSVIGGGSGDPVFMP